MAERVRNRREKIQKCSPSAQKRHRRETGWRCVVEGEGEWRGSRVGEEGTWCKDGRKMSVRVLRGDEGERILIIRIQNAFSQ